MENKKTFIIPRKKEREIIFGEVILSKNYSEDGGLFKVQLNRVFIIKYFSETFMTGKRFITPTINGWFKNNEIKLNTSMNYFQFSIYKDESFNEFVARLEPKGWIMLDTEIRGKQIGSLIMALLIKITQENFPDVHLKDVNLSYVDCKDPINCKRRNRFYEKFGWKVIIDKNGNGVAKAKKLKDLKPKFDKNIKFTDLDFSFLINYRKKLAITRYENMKNKQLYREYKKISYDLIDELDKSIIHHIKRKLSKNLLIILGKEFWMLFKNLYSNFRRY